ncbi:MAG TPA: hypothetical protein VGS01_09705 [Candidatus Limnocylindria bacterium]|jgi:hypothetical protein|nr:hypothetical protein [Candidatus Limnocylindria bacterium]
MQPIRTKATTGNYGAPPGSSDVSGLPYYRTYNETMYPGAKVPVIHSTWDLTENERKAIANGAKIELAIYGEPIPPVSLIVDPTAEEVADDSVPDAFSRGFDKKEPA